jgi:hypothetical protein
MFLVIAPRQEAWCGKIRRWGGGKRIDPPHPHHPSCSSCICGRISFLLFLVLPLTCPVYTQGFPLQDASLSIRHSYTCTDKQTAILKLRGINSQFSTFKISFTCDSVFFILLMHIVTNIHFMINDISLYYGKASDRLVMIVLNNKLWWQTSEGRSLCQGRSWLVIYLTN